jgi:UDP-GlcNAc:undecaprenyl-phosphate GlcNAc-1-phosphate transferase
MFAAFLVSIFLSRLMGNALDDQETIKLLAIIGSAGIIGGIGFLGDIGKIPSKVEFTLQIFPSVLAIAFGVRVGFIPNPLIAIPLTLFYLVGGACAMNLLDGMDGLAAGITIIASMFFGLIGLIQGNELVVILSVALLGSVLGFLYYNFHPARIFMGDIGSLFLGFTLAAMAVLSTSRPYDFKGFVMPVLILGVPVFDTSLAIARRLVNRKGIISGDRRHFYDLLNARGLTIRTTVLVMYGLALTLGVTALLSFWMTTSMTLLIAGLEALLLLALAFRLGGFHA